MEGTGNFWFTVYCLRFTIYGFLRSVGAQAQAESCLLLIGWEKLRLNMMIGRIFFEKTKLKLTALIFVTTRPLPSKL